MKRKKLSLFFILVLLMSVLTIFFGYATANAEGKTTANGVFIYEKDPYENVASLVKYVGDVENVVVPEEIDGYRIIDVREKAFENNDNIVSVEFGDSVEYLYDDAFYVCPNLEYVKLGKNAYKINKGFYNCPKLTSVVIDPENTFLNNREGLIYSYDLKTLHFCPDGYTGNSALGKVDLLDTTEKIDASAFYWCSEITEITVPQGVTVFEETVFDSCKNLSKINLPESLTEILKPFVVGCKNLKSITIPKGVTKIENGVFSLAKSLEKIDVESENEKYASANGILYNKAKNIIFACPVAKSGSFTVNEGVKLIVADAFANTKITKLVIPESLTQIERHGLRDTNKLKEITVNSSNAKYSSLDGMLYTKKKTYLIWCPAAKEGKITLYKYTENINGYAFSQSNAATEIVLPSRLTSIGNYAFYGNEALQEITVPSSVTEIGDYAFSECIKLEKVNFKKGLESIGEGAFMLSGVRNIKLPESLEYLGVGAFYGCADLLTLDLNSKLCDIPDQAFFCCTSLTSISIPKGIESIGAEAFFNCCSASYLFIPESITAIGDRAFYYTSSLSIVHYAGTDMKKTNYYDEDNSLYAFETGKRYIGKMEPCTEHEYRYSLYCSNCNYCTFDSAIVSETVDGFERYYYYKDAKKEKYTGVIELDGVYYYIQHGVWERERAVIEYNGKNVLVTQGVIDYSYSGMFSIDAHNEVYVKNGIVYENLDRPALKLSVVFDGIKLNWEEVPCAIWYNIYKSTYSNGKWSDYKYVTRTKYSAYYTDSGVSGRVRYRIYAYNLTHISKYSASKSAIYLKQPSVKVKNAVSGVYVSWNKIKGAKNYKVYRSTYSNGKWSNYKIYKTTTATNYTDKNVKSGAKVRYSVYACNGEYESFFKSGASVTRLSAVTPKVGKVIKGIKISWSKVTKAKGYRIYRRQYKNGKWTELKLIKSTSSLKYTDKSAKKGIKYQYVVRAYNGDYNSAVKYSKTIKR